MQWYSASAWEHHSLKHLKDNLPIHPDDPVFLSNSWVLLVMMLFLVPPDKACLMRKRSENGLKLPNSSLRKNKTPVKSPLQAPKTEGLRLSSLESQVSKCQITQGPIKSSIILKFTPRNNDE